jgi:hypothetical protein
MLVALTYRAVRGGALCLSIIGGRLLQGLRSRSAEFQAAEHSEKEVETCDGGVRKSLCV